MVPPDSLAGAQVATVVRAATAAVRAGHDPQLEKAVEVVLAELKKHPLPVYKRPRYPNYAEQPL